MASSCKYQCHRCVQSKVLARPKASWQFMKEKRIMRSPYTMSDRQLCIQLSTWWPQNWSGASCFFKAESLLKSVWNENLENVRGRRKKYSRPAAKLKTERRAKMFDYHSLENHRLACHSSWGDISTNLSWIMRHKAAEVGRSWVFDRLYSNKHLLGKKW